jgi:acyl-CoA synthetase (AMP-forming)/AMP-acid ligase II
MIWRWPEAHPPDAPALRFEGRRIAYGALARDAARVASALAARGIGRGDRVAFLGANHPAQLALLFACARIGAVQVPLNWRLAPPELRFILGHSGAATLFATREMRPLAEAAAPEGGCAVLDAEAPPPEGTPPEPRGRDEDPLLLVYTSGTTGRPKGAVLDGGAVAANARNAVALFGLTAADRVLTVLPLFHVGGLNIQTTPALMAGAEVVLHPRFDPGAVLRSLAEDRPTLSLLVPAVMRAVIEHPGWAAADLSSLRAVGTGSSDVPVPLIETFHARGVPVQQVYGATETGPVAIGQTRTEALAAPGSIGRPAALTEARIQDAEGRPLPPGAEGEIALRGPNLARGYWRDPAATAAAFREGGWFPTGDVGRVDAEGRFWFTGRLKHVVISGGVNVYPAEVERVLLTAPGVREGAVCGRPDARWGEVPVAVVVPGEGFDPAAVLRHFEGRLARFKHPRAVVAVEALPRTALGKVELARLRAIAAGG